VASKTDIVSLKWVIGLMNKQAENAELALVEYSQDMTQKKPLLQCMWAVHQITSTLRALGIKKAEMLSIEMERGLNFLYKDRVVGERRKLTMGGLMQALKVLPAYLAHVQSVREDTGRGLEQYVNDLRRWVGERPRPQAFFFHMDIPTDIGITAGGQPASDEEIKSRANVMLALYLEMAKSALRKRNVRESMKTVARISRKMQLLFAGTEQERFWFTLIGICEGIAGGLIVPDECIAQIFKAGAFMIKHAREKGSEADPAADYDGNLQQMLFYIASCKSRPVHIGGIREAFNISDETLEASRSGLIHLDALVTALSGALSKLDGAVEHITAHDLSAVAASQGELDATLALEGIEAAQQRLLAAGQMAHADSLQQVYERLDALFSGKYGDNTEKAERIISEIVRGIVDVKLDLEHKLEHGVCSSFSSREFELRESVIGATFSQMSTVENHLHTILRRKALAAALAKKPLCTNSVMRLTFALHRYLNKSEEGHEALRQAVQDADNGEPDIDLLYQLATDYFNSLSDTPDRQAIRLSLQLMTEISGALSFASMEREGEIIERCRQWLEAASEAGCVREDDAFRCFADVFAQIELHLQRSVLDPLDDTSHMLAFAEQRAAELAGYSNELHRTDEVTDSLNATVPAIHNYVQDGEIPVEFREVFIEESEEIVAELNRLVKVWLADPVLSQSLRDMRRHFHTFKGNGRAVGANILGELGWAAQDMLDRLLEGEIQADERLQALVAEVVAALPALVMSYKQPNGLDIDAVRHLTNRCFDAASAGEDDLALDLSQVDGSSAKSAVVATMPTASPAVSG
jgi:HPt (histidine-containing phosphotransfer) domain-containing protein